MTRLDDRLTRMLDTRPYLLAVGTVACLLVIWDTGRTVFDHEGERVWLDWVVLGSVGYSLVALFVLLPRILAPRAASRGEEHRLPLLRWAFAVAPFLIAFGASAAGADAWVATATLAVSVLLLFIDATATARRSPGRI